MMNRLCSRCGLTKDRHNLTIGANQGHAIIYVTMSMDEDGVEIFRVCTGFKPSIIAGKDDRCDVCYALYRDVAHRCEGCGHDHHLHRFGRHESTCACGCEGREMTYRLPDPYVFPPQAE